MMLEIIKVDSSDALDLVSKVNGSPRHHTVITLSVNGEAVLASAVGYMLAEDTFVAIMRSISSVYPKLKSVILNDVSLRVIRSNDTYAIAATVEISDGEYIYTATEQAGDAINAFLKALKEAICKILN